MPSHAGFCRERKEEEDLNEKRCLAVVAAAAAMAFHLPPAFPDGDFFFLEKVGSHNKE